MVQMKVFNPVAQEVNTSYLYKSTEIMSSVKVEVEGDTVACSKGDAKVVILLDPSTGYLQVMIESFCVGLDSEEARHLADCLNVSSLFLSRLGSYVTEVPDPPQDPPALSQPTVWQRFKYTLTGKY